MSETKNQKFLRLAENRYTNAAKSIELLGNLTGYAYESTPEQRQLVVDLLQKNISDLAETYGVPLNGSEKPAEAASATSAPQTPEDTQRASVSPVRTALTLTRSYISRAIRYIEGEDVPAAKQVLHKALYIQPEEDKGDAA